jgi:hypothetical protein
VNALSRLESLLEAVVEGPFRRLFGGRLDPVHLARRLAQSMDDHQLITWNLPVVPNRYSIFLSVGDFDAVSKFKASLESELARYVRGRAEENPAEPPQPDERGGLVKDVVERRGDQVDPDQRAIDVEQNKQVVPAVHA